MPPVTPDRSPPASRMTGADSPVIADSSTEATPSIISPSPGTTWPASMTTVSPACKSVDVVSSIFPFGRRRCAGVSRRVLRSESAWALPRASANAVAKLANRHGQRQPDVERQQVSHRGLASRNPDGLNREQNAQHGPHFDDEHHRILPLNVRPEHDKRLLECLAQQVRGKQACSSRLAATKFDVVDLYRLGPFSLECR